MMGLPIEGKLAGAEGINNDNEDEHLNYLIVVLAYFVPLAASWNRNRRRLMKEHLKG